MTNNYTGNFLIHTKTCVFYLAFKTKQSLAADFVSCGMPKHQIIIFIFKV